ncbi:HNH endonuclease [Sinorhizobium fredii]|uniref:HNH endonuclease n=1 Tax=Rhizobium fredii TaxID=380 RepID=UPI0012FDFAD6|nr:HNH endonuclease [Sinorhizobium fredii]
MDSTGDTRHRAAHGACMSSPRLCRWSASNACDGLVDTRQHRELADDTMTAALEPLRYFIKEPIPAIFEACELLSAAADAHLNGDREVAEALFCQADMREIWNWINPDWEKPHLNVGDHQPEADTQEVPKTMRDPLRHPPLHVKAAVLARDGYRCRYCGIPVIHTDIRKIAHALYPDAVPWEWRDPRKQHAAFQCLWLQYDHVVPHSHGGSSTEENIVISCALCNFGKDKYTLRQLGLSIRVCGRRCRSPGMVSNA